MTITLMVPVTCMPGFNDQVSNPNKSRYHTLPDEGYSNPNKSRYHTLPDEGYSRNVLCTLNLISLHLFLTTA
jgi:hypothetical protein